jgi:hypothetical protein
VALVCKSKALLISECKRCGRRHGTVPTGSHITGKEAIVIEEVDHCPVELAVKKIGSCRRCAAEATEAKRKGEHIDWPMVRSERITARIEKRVQLVKQDSSV